MFRTTFVALTLICALASGIPASANGPVAGVMSVTPVTEHSCMAAQLVVAAGQPITGLRWFHNDGSVSFVRVLLLEAEAGVPPDVAQTAVTLETVGAGSLSWGEVAIEPPVTSQTGLIYAVFELPPYGERTGDGLGGGSGLGFAQSTGRSNGYVSPEGWRWARLHDGYNLSVEAVVGAGKGSAASASLASLQADAPRGWWSQRPAPTEAPPEDLEPLEEAAGGAGGRSPLSVAPNPFNPRTEIRLYLGEASPVRVEVHDIRGRLVRVLHEGPLAAGPHDLIWNGDDDRARRVASGVYFITMTTPQGEHRQRVALLR